MVRLMMYSFPPCMMLCRWATGTHSVVYLTSLSPASSQIGSAVASQESSDRSDDSGRSESEPPPDRLDLCAETSDVPAQQAVMIESNLICTMERMFKLELRRPKPWKV